MCNLWQWASHVNVKQLSFYSLPKVILKYVATMLLEIPV